MKSAGLGRIKFHKNVINVDAVVYYVNDIGYKMLIFTDESNTLPPFKLISAGKNLSDNYFEGFLDSVPICKWFIKDYNIEYLENLVSNDLSKIMEYMSATEHSFCRFIKNFEFPDISEVSKVKYWEVPHYVFGERCGGKYISFFRVKRSDQYFISVTVLDKTIMAFGLEMANRINNDDKIINWTANKEKSRLSILEPYLKGESGNYRIENEEILIFEGR